MKKVFVFQIKYYLSIIKPNKMTNLNEIELSHIRMAILTRINFLEKWFIGEPNTEGIIEMYKKEIAELKELSEKLYEQT